MGFTGMPRRVGSTGWRKGKDSGSWRYRASNVGISACLSSSGLKTVTNHYVMWLIKFQIWLIMVSMFSEYCFTFLAWLGRLTGWCGAGHFLLFQLSLYLWFLLLRLHRFLFRFYRHWLLFYLRFDIILMNNMNYV